MSQVRERVEQGPEPLRPSLRIFGIFAGLVILGGAVLAPRVTGANLLLAGWYALGVGLGAVFFIAVHRVAGARWTAPLERIPRALASLVPLGSGLVLVAMIAAGSLIYPWMAEPAGAEDSFKRFWLQPGFAIGRAVLIATIWLAFARRFHRPASKAISAAFLVVFGYTVWIASVDWLMSLEPHWYSTMFGVGQFAGLFLSALAVISIMAVILSSRGELPGFGPSHLHDLGKLLFAFSTFWMYIWFSEAMLIWYGNIPEEAIHYTARMRGDWKTMFVLAPLLLWAVPFVALMSRRAKMNPKVILRIALLILVGRWVELYLAIMPAISPDTARISGWDAAIGLGAASVAALLVMRALDRPLAREALVLDLPEMREEGEDAAAG